MVNKGNNIFHHCCWKQVALNRFLFSGSSKFLTTGRWRNSEAPFWGASPLLQKSHQGVFFFFLRLSNSSDEMNQTASGATARTNRPSPSSLFKRSAGKRDWMRSRQKPKQPAAMNQSCRCVILFSQTKCFLLRIRPASWFRSRHSIALQCIRKLLITLAQKKKERKAGDF